MKKISYFLLMFLLHAILIVSCSDDDKEEERQIEIPDQSEQTQNAFADEKTSGSFTFTAKSGWMATVTEETRLSVIPWLRLLHNGEEKYSGDAGTFTLTIELDLNYSGESRSATIIINCGGDTITIIVIQERTNKDGKVPELKYMVHVSVAGPGTAIAAVDGIKITQAVEGETVTLTAIPESGYAFDKWVVLSDDNIEIIPDTEATTSDVTVATFRMPAGEVSVRADFLASEYPVMVTSTAGGMANATVDGIEITQAVEGETVTLTAIPESGYAFDKWVVLNGDIIITADDMVTTGNIIVATFNMTAGEVNIRAEFVKTEYNIFLTSGTGGTAMATIEDEVVAKAMAGEIVTLTAIPESGYAFDKWTVITDGNIHITPDYVASTGNVVVATFTMPSHDVTMRAEFKESRRPQTDYYGSWKYDNEFGGFSEVTISENKFVHRIKDSQGGNIYGYTIEELTWIVYNEPSGNSNYPAGYKITGVLIAITGCEVPKPDGGYAMEAGEQVMVPWYIHKDGQSLAEGHWGGWDHYAIEEKPYKKQ